MNLAGFKLVLLFTRGKRQVQCGAVSKYTLLLSDSKVVIFIMHFRQIRVNQQPKW